MTALAAVGALCLTAVPARAASHRTPEPPAASSTAPHATPRSGPGALPRAAAAPAVGASTPFRTYEAEAGSPGGGATVTSLTAPPATQYSSAALEASGHAYVHLGGAGSSVQWTNTTGAPISFLNVRASIPDSASGGGTTATLDLYVDGVFRQ
ncbi:MAG: coagulation factor 5/8 type domain-containing protein, partial [Actinomycetia bacterium]|nr:coagulation factor 5/8 type domain-containing protein [Actinomycetes bacterium]